MAVNEISTVNGIGTATATAAASKSMDKEAFLTLLITQLQHQDPLNPADSTEFTAQLAQFSSLEQLSNINENLSLLKLYQASNNNAQAVSFIGKEVIAHGSGLEVKSGRPAVCEFELGAPAQRVVVSIYDAAGDFVADVQRTAAAAGMQRLDWDGRDRNGNSVAEGMYTFEVQAEGANGERVDVKTHSTGTVTGVSFEDGVTYLNVGGGRIAIGDVIRVNAGTGSSPVL